MFINLLITTYSIIVSGLINKTIKNLRQVKMTFDSQLYYKTHCLLTLEKVSADKQSCILFSPHSRQHVLYSVPLSFEVYTRLSMIESNRLNVVQILKEKGKIE